MVLIKGSITRETEVPLIYVSAISTILIAFNLFTIYATLNYFGYLTMFSLEYFVIALGILWLLNHLIFVRNKKFLDYSFNTHAVGSLLILAYILLTALSFIVLANKNRERIFSEREKAKTELNR